MRDNKELYSNFQLLVCCLEFVLRQTPSFLLNTPYDSFRFESLNSSSSDQESVLLKHLALAFDVSLNEVKDLYIKTSLFFQDLLSSDGELDLDQLIAEYNRIHKNEGDFNEMLFLDKDWHVMPPDLSTSFESGVTQSGKSLRKEAISPSKMTPTRAAVSTVQQFKSIIKVKEPEPTKKLLEIFASCKPDPSDLVKDQVISMREVFASKFCETHQFHDRQIAFKRYCLAIRLFFQILEAILEKESSQLSETVLGTLLQKKEFIISMIACSIEVVLVTFGQSWNQVSKSMTSEAAACKFPWILDAFSLQAFEFYKVIESFIKAENELPLDIVKHLQNAEFSILESLAWKENSSLFNVIGNWEVDMITPTNSPSKSTEASSSAAKNQGRSSVHLFLSPVRQQYPQCSPVKSHQNSDYIEGASQSFPVDNSKPQRKSQSLSHFLSRVCRLGFCRLSKLCTFLQIGSDVQHKIWTCFEHCITHLPHLVRNRHIDQILMCCIFGMCRVVGIDVKFKMIVHEYKKMPHARPEVHKYVYISKDKEDSIITFYNQVFLNEIKSYILQFSPQKSSTPQLSPLPKQNLMSPRGSLMAKKNFTVSPMKDFEFKTPASPSQMTPSTRLLYSFGDPNGSAEKLKHINAAMMARGGANSAKKRLNMDDMTM